MGAREDAEARLAVLAEQGRLRTKRIVAGGAVPALLLDGRVVVDFSSNNYLGLAGDERVRVAAMAELERSGVGAAASRLIMTHEAHEALEAELAVWLGVEQVLLFNSGYAANVGLLSALASAGDVVFSDELNHASIIDGCRLSRARVVVYRHGDLGELERGLRTAPEARKFVVSESLFSMDGDVAEVRRLRELADVWGATLVLDEAHALGVLGPQGRGVAARVGVAADVLVGTLGKALGSHGAFVATSAPVARLLWNRARSLVFSTGMPPAVAAASLAAVALVRGEVGEGRRAVVARNIASLRSRLSLGPCTHIVPWILGADRRATATSEALLASGLFVQAIRPPTVPEGSARLRIAVGQQDAAAVDALADTLLSLMG
ncbi:MAG: 8-amino-7-oxononanoate synthase [Kofleriaceae bacterium]